MHWVKKINHIDGYKISLTFNDNITKLVDLEGELWGEVFDPLKDYDYFKLAKVVEDTIVWPNEADFSPDFLYEIGKVVKEKPVKQARTRIRPKAKN